MQSLNRGILSLTILSTALFSDTNPFIKKLPFQEAIIEYTLSGNQKGVKTLYVKDYGLNRVIYQNINSKLMKKSSNKAKYTITTKKWIYKISSNTNQAIKTPNLSNLLYIAYKELSKQEQNQVEENLKLLNFNPIKNNKFKIIKNFTKIEEIPCDMILSGTKRECYGYDGSLLLKSTTKIMGFNKDEIVSNIFKTKVDSKLFDLSNLTIKDDKKQSLKLYKLSQTIVGFLKNRLNTKKIFIKNKLDKKDYNQIIQEGIKQLDKI